MSTVIAKLGKLALIIAALAALLPAAASAHALGSLGAPFSIGVGLRHGPERLEDLYLPDPVLGSPYAYQFESPQDPAPSFTWTGDVPDGLRLDESGLLGGVPTKIGHYTFVALAENGVGEGTEQQANVEVVAAPLPALEAPNLYAPTNAVLMGNVNPGNLPSQAWFEYWPSADPTPARTELLSLGVGTKPVEVVGKLADLAPSTEYSYRLAASNGASPAPVLSEVATFTTGLPPPVAGQSFNIDPVAGKVKTKCRKEKAFSRLERPKQVTLDCQIDAENGTVAVTASKGSSGETQTADFWGGLFAIDQEAGDNRKAVLSLAGKRRCEKRRGKHGTSRPRRAYRRGKHGRRLWGSGKGNYKTVGSHGAATVRGTIWLVADRCDGSTLFKVRRGTVEVRDFVKGKTIVLHAGDSYIAKVDVGRLP